MTLPSYAGHCQGRTQRSMGVATLRTECTDCERRTANPTDVQSVRWIYPPKLSFWGTCPMYLSPVEVEDSIE